MSMAAFIFVLGTKKISQVALSGTLTFLQPGMRVLWEHKPHRVLMVNDCRALIECESRQVVVVKPETGPNAGKEVKILRSGQRHSISPNSQLPILTNHE